MPIAEWVKQIVEKCQPEGTVIPSIGAILRHPDGRKIRITKGQFWGEFGLSNFWYWREVKRNGTLGPEEHGYGAGFTKIKSKPKKGSHHA